MPQRYAHSRQVLQRRSLDKWLLLTDATSEPIVLAGTAADVWVRLREGSSIEAVAQHLAVEYGLDSRKIIEDITLVIAQLVRLGMLQECGD